MGFLPVSREDMERSGIKQLDFVYIIGDAYVDHPSYGPAIISRVLSSHGYTVGIIPQPDWKDPDSIGILGEPRLAFLVSSGNMDSMVNHYTVAKKRREKDAYTPNEEMGKRPDYAVSVYGNLIRRTYKKTPVIIGGIEASLRRLSHYDYWSNKVKRSVLLDSAADLLIYGMGEKTIIEVADALNSGIDISDITFIRGTVYKTRDIHNISDVIMLPTYEEVSNDKCTYSRSFYTQYKNTDAITARPLSESYGNRGYIVQNPPQYPLTTQEMDDVYDLPYMRRPHPMYDEFGGIKSLEEVKFSITSCRGCYGGCNFCALTFHQGRVIQSRSHESIIREAELLTRDPDFKGYIHDVGGPTADFRQRACKKQEKYGVCTDRQCLFPKPCPNLISDHRDYIELLDKLKALPGIKKVFIRSGVRFDYILSDTNSDFLKVLCRDHVSGLLKVAPEHVSDNVLHYMGKPSHEVYREFTRQFDSVNKKLNKKQYVVPYLMSSHPGSTMKDAVLVALYLKEIGHNPEQVQDFYPTPSTLSSCMYYTGIDPRDNTEVYVPRNPHEKALQRALLQFKNPENYDMIVEALMIADRRDLIGFGPECLVPPRKIKNAHKNASKNGHIIVSNKGESKTSNNSARKRPTKGESKAFEKSAGKKTIKGTKGFENTTKKSSNNGQVKTSDNITKKRLNNSNKRNSKKH